MNKQESDILNSGDLQSLGSKGERRYRYYGLEKGYDESFFPVYL